MRPEKEIQSLMLEPVLKVAYIIAYGSLLSNVLSSVYPYRQEFLTFTDSSLIVAQRQFYKIWEGKGYQVGYRFEDVGDNESVDIYVENPEGSGKLVYMLVPKISPTGLCFLDIYEVTDVTSHGTELQPMNLRTGANEGSVLRIEYGGTYVTGNRLLSDVIPGGTSVRAVGTVAELGEGIIFDEGSRILIRITNKSASTAYIGIRLVWWEE